MTVEEPGDGSPADLARTKMLGLLAEHEAWRANCINLIASENALSPSVRAVLNSDLIQRYADYTGRDLGARRYRGNQYTVQIETAANDLAKDLFDAQYVELRPLAGHIAGASVLLALCQPGDTVLEVGRDGGGHREASKLAGSSLINLDVHYLPFDPDRYNIDMVAATEQVRALKPRVVILGSSNFLFPHPVAEFARLIAGMKDTLLVYDASHVLGLIAAGRFQDPLAEGADVVFGSTHKTFPGPQGGIIFTNRPDLIDIISEAAYPGLVTNHHPFRLPSLYLAMVEMKTWGAEYADAVSENARKLADEIESRGVPCVRGNGVASESHTILLRVADYGTADAVTELLEEANVITTGAHLPRVLGTHGIRVGAQEITRRGADAASIAEIADIMATVIRQTARPECVRERASSLAAGMKLVKFTWPT